jgi:two-component system NtrC family sensor kinase
MTRKRNEDPELPGAAERELDALDRANRKYIRYIRDKVNQLLQVMGTFPLQPEELDDATLLDLDPIGIVAGSFEQILEHLRKTNRELTITRDELQAIFDATGVGISIIDQDFRILKCNEKQRDLLVEPGMPDVTGRFCYEIYCNKESPGLDCPAVDTLATGRPVVVREVKKKGKHFQIVTTPFTDGEGNVTGVIEVLLDISGKKRAEDAEKEQRGFYLAEKSKLATVIESLSDGLFVTDGSGNIVSFNKAACELTGYGEADVAGVRCDRFLEMLAGNAAPSLGDGDLRNRELAVRTKDGGRRFFSLNSALAKDAEGVELGTVFTFRDVTEEKERRELYYRTEKLVALGQLSAGVAHELNTPLGSVLGYARLLLKDPDLSSRQKERLEIIAEQAKRSSAIIRGLLSFARQAKPASRHVRDIDVNVVVSSALKVLGTETEKLRIAVSADLGAVPAVRADEAELVQAVLNVLLNAIQAVKSDGEIGIRTLCGNGAVKIEIRDSGPGIPEDVKPRIFDPFFTTKPVGEGTGLGLSISAGIVSEHGGAIDVENSAAGGAVFTISLPVVS